MFPRCCIAFLCIAFVANAVRAQTTVDFTNDVQPILAKRCYACHGPDDAEGGLRFTDRESALVEGDTGEFAIVPGDANASHLIARITAGPDDWFDRMPPEGDAVPDDEVEILRRWIDEGAPWIGHWAFEPIDVPEVPVVSDASWSVNPIDSFVWEKLNQAGLPPNPPADRRTLVRRAYHDLLGLPPTFQEVQEFVNNESPLAFENLVDRLLESPHYGERWGRHWLDLVRYAESNSFERDDAKPNAHKYRDYVIRSFNDDKPYDQFVKEQLAGDQIDDVTADSLTATGFYRLGIWDDEPADPKQSFYDEMDDLITTVGQGFLGLTINCARCHDHKIDPIPQAEYYSLLSFFADVTTYGTRRDKLSNNQIDVSPENVRQAYDRSDRRIAALEGQLREVEQSGIVKMSASDQRATEGSKRERDKVLTAKLEQYLTETQWSLYSDLKQQLAAETAAKRSLPPRDRVLGLAKTRQTPRETFVFFRGSPHSPTDLVQPVFPSIFDSEPQLISDRRRLALAEWICQPDNRLASRVMVNRIWQFHFGRGIVRSSNNFGQLGTPPTHPALLDWLASRFVVGGWKMKSMHRLIMNSRAYQMSSRSRGDGEAIDPGNDLFWKFDSRRLSAEEVRDSMLAASNSLNRDVYGPSVYPQLSQEVLQGQSKPGKGWGESTEREQNRRSVYIHVKRSLLTPLMTAFDFPDPDRTCEARFMTLQPGQALALLNSDFAHQQAARLAQRIDAGDDHERLIRRAIRAVLKRDATSEELFDGQTLMRSLVEEFDVSPERAAELYCLSVMNWNEFLFLD